MNIVCNQELNICQFQQAKRKWWSYNSS